MPAPAHEQPEPRRTRLAIGVRLALVVAGLLAASWMGLALKSSRLTISAEKHVNQAKGAGKASPAVRQGYADFDRARAFNDDTQVLIRQAAASIVVPDLARARALAADAARREPENFDAWTLRYSLEKSHDPPAAARAKRRALAIDPRAGRLFD